jgi:hypothetical protein
MNGIEAFLTMGELSRQPPARPFGLRALRRKAPLACLVEAEPGWDIECRIDADRASLR